jgi:GrpB-like predicted nucleotidyltransferase (UPF0157 family)
VDAHDPADPATGPEAELFDRPGGEPVELHPPSPRWTQLAVRWTAALGRALAPLQHRIEHVGSTAVPGLVAKPVVDLLVVVPDVDDEASYRPALESLGLVLRAREPGHRFFRPPAGQPRTVHVHVCRPGSSWERDFLVFRDRLRADPLLADSYAALKLRLAAELGADRAAYTEAKAGFIRSAIDG